MTTLWPLQGHNQVLTVGQNQHTMTQLAFVFSMRHLLHHWQAEQHMILQKAMGFLMVNKLHTILLMEEDFNLGNKLLLDTK